MPDDLQTKKRKARGRLEAIMRAVLVLLIFTRLKITVDARTLSVALATELTRALAENFVEDRTPLQRASSRDLFQDVFNDRTRELASEAAAARTVEEVEAWLSQMSSAVASHSLGQLTLGLGRVPLPSELFAAGKMVGFEFEKLSGFAATIFARAEEDDPVSEDYVAARAELYGGTGRSLWYAGDELGSGFGVVIDYEARDDAGTCTPCLIAEEESPYLPGEGPFPGTVCKGRGRCRCQRTPRSSMSDYLRLISRRDRRSQFLEF